jgi:hypothetical protein
MKESITKQINRIQNQWTETLNVAIFWHIMPLSPYVNQRFGGTYHIHLQGRKSPAALWFLARPIFHPEDGSESLRNVGPHTDYTALYPGRRQHSWRTQLLSS